MRKWIEFPSSNRSSGVADEAKLSGLSNRSPSGLESGQRYAKSEFLKEPGVMSFDSTSEVAPFVSFSGPPKASTFSEPRPFGTHSLTTAPVSKPEERKEPKLPAFSIKNTAKIRQREIPRLSAEEKSHVQIPSETIEEEASEEDEPILKNGDEELYTEFCNIFAPTLQSVIPMSEKKLRSVMMDMFDQSPKWMKDALSLPRVVLPVPNVLVLMPQKTYEYTYEEEDEYEYEYEE